MGGGRTVSYVEDATNTGYGLTFDPMWCPKTYYD